MDTTLCRHAYADDIAKAAELQTPELIDALRTVPRERFLRPGPWLLRDEEDFRTGRTTPGTEAHHVYRNCSIAIDTARQLFNGAPGIVAASIDALRLTPGARVLHVGAGLGYYSAVIGHIVGSAGRVLATEVDEVLASEARRNLTSVSCVEVQTSDSAARLNESFDAVLVSVGVTHPQRTWLDALRIGGRIVLPLTVSMPVMGATLGKGVTVILVKEALERLSARTLAMTAIYSAVGLRDDALNSQLGLAMMRRHASAITGLRLDEHAPGSTCWLHSEHFCLTTDE